jgi:hypothetical protein
MPTPRLAILRRGSGRRGITFLEVVAASAMLGIIAAGVFSMSGAMVSSQWRQMQDLAASELASRMVILYLDDTFEMPNRSQLLDHGPDRYRWDYKEEPIVLTEPRADGRNQKRTMGLTNDRYKIVTVRVWLSEESKGSYAFTPSVPHAVLTRPVDPFAIRNQDAFERLTQDPNRYQQWLLQMMGGAAPGGTPTNRGGGGSRGGRSGATPQGGNGGGR